MAQNQYKFYQAEPNQESDFVIITLEDIEAINPNSKTCPSFRNKKDYELAQKVYKKWGVLVNESEPEKNFWEVRIRTPFNMSNDSGLFRSFRNDLIPLYEAKYIHHFNHRYCTWDGSTTQSTHIQQVSDSNFIVKTQYYIEPNLVFSRFKKSNWCLVFRDIARATDERTMISSIIPNFSCGNTLSIIETEDLTKALFLLATLNSISFDFFARQVVGGTHFNHWILKQLPVIDFNCINQNLSDLIKEKAFHLLYTAIDLKGMAEEYGYSGNPFQWNDKERFQLQCELDSIYAHLYGLEKDEMEYILETFPIVKRKDVSKYGSYRTKETILKFYDEFAWVKDEI